MTDPVKTGSVNDMSWKPSTGQNWRPTKGERSWRAKQEGGMSCLLGKTEDEQP